MKPFPLTYFCSMTTPNGRFMTQKKICLSMSDCEYSQLFSASCVPYHQTCINRVLVAFQFTLKAGTLCGLCQGIAYTNIIDLLPSFFHLPMFWCYSFSLKISLLISSWTFLNAAYSLGFFPSWLVRVSCKIWISFNSLSLRHQNCSWFLSFYDAIFGWLNYSLFLWNIELHNMIMLVISHPTYIEIHVDGQ